ncbi:hypothetical protein [Halorubrum californiense]|uniref:hypothetical protein n=1 Tax=Halorubrum californiense TaxID=416585 RepID=UPI00126849C2|nr:hypothetical protein [Halorubrum californiense]
MISTSVYKRDCFVESGDGVGITVEDRGHLDIAGDYLLTDSQTGEELVVLDNDLSLFEDTWRIRDAEDGSLLAEINSRGALFTVGRKILPVGQWIGHKFEITDAGAILLGVSKAISPCLIGTKSRSAIAVRSQ